MHLVFALFLYVLTTSYIAYKAFNVLPRQTWGAVFLIIFLFVGLNTVLKSFGNRHQQRQLFYYSYYAPTEIFIGKVIYNFALLLVLAFTLAVVLLLFASKGIENWSLFMCSLTLGSLGLSVIFSFVSLLSLKSNNNSTIFSVLALPLVLPILLFLAIILVFFALSLLLFPSLWKS